MSITATLDANELRSRAKRFASQHLEPVAAELDHLGEYPDTVMQALAEGGYLGMLTPVSHGGSGIDFIDYLDVIQTFSGNCAAVASLINQHCLVTSAIARWGSEEQKQSLLPALAEGSVIASCAVGESGPGPGPLPAALTATTQADEFVLKGCKAFVRNPGAQLLLICAARQTGTEHREQILALLETGSTGMQPGARVATMGLTACPVAPISFDGVSVNADAVLGSPAAGQAMADELLALSALMEAAQTVGIGMAAVACAAEHANRRVQFGQPVADLQAVQSLLAKVRTHCQLADDSLRQAARLVDADVPFTTQAAMLKSFLAEHGAQMLIDCCQIEGGFGVTESAPKGIREPLPLARMFRDIAGTTLLDAPWDFPEGIIARSISEPA